MTTMIDAMLHIARLLDAVGARYAFVGSIVSARYGVPRLTNDVDLISDLNAAQIPQFTRLLGDDFYFSETAIRRALASYRSFNLIHQASQFKIDIFSVAPRSFAEHCLARRLNESATPDTGETVFMITPEDVILAKLLWFVKGGGASQNQWKDVRQVIEVQRENLDFAYLREWAASLHISELLEQALDEAVEGEAR